MSLYGHTHIELGALKRWANSLSVDDITQIDVGGDLITLDSGTRKILELQIKGFVDLLNNLNFGDDWRECQGILSPMFYNAFVRINNSAIRIGDYYECLITPSNIKTYKKIIQGFDYQDIGAIHLRNKAQKGIATIGMKSDLIWTAFYEYFINHDESGFINHIYANHERYLSIQLFDVENKTMEQINALVNEILLQVSMEYDMDFRIFEVDPIFKQIGESTVRNMQFTSRGYEQIPVLYFNNAINSSDERLAYLSYYQVIEYFFVRTQNYYFLDELSKVNLQSINHNELRKVLNGYKKISNEREALRLVLLKAINVIKFKSWISANTEYEQIYCNSHELKIDITKEDKKVISQLVERVYSYRCSIAHAKGDVEEYIAIPLLSNQRISKEIPLLKYLAFEVIANCSEV